jgi:hypothetical protein
LEHITSKYLQGDRKGQIKEDGYASDAISKQVEGMCEIIHQRKFQVRNMQQKVSS